MSEIPSFSTGEIRHEFILDGVRYYIPGITYADLEQIDKLTTMPPKERITAFRELMASRVKRVSRWKFWQKSGRLAVYVMDPHDVTKVFNLWKPSKTPGESSASRNK